MDISATFLVRCALLGIAAGAVAAGVGVIFDLDILYAFLICAVIVVFSTRFGSGLGIGSDEGTGIKSKQT